MKGDSDVSESYNEWRVPVPFRSVGGVDYDIGEGYRRGESEEVSLDFANCYEGSVGDLCLLRRHWFGFV